VARAFDDRGVDDRRGREVHVRHPHRQHAVRSEAVLDGVLSAAVDTPAELGKGIVVVVVAVAVAVAVSSSCWQRPLPSRRVGVPAATSILGIVLSAGAGWVIHGTS